MIFYLGTDMPSWLWRHELADIPLFVSHRRMAPRRSPFPPALAPYAIDSGAFTEVNTHGRWVTTPAEYVEALRRYADELGPFDFAAPQDSMCEPFVLDRVASVTGRRPTVEDQQARTVGNLLDLRELAPDLPIVPVLQGWTVDDYLDCVNLYRDAGIDLRAEPLVGVGSVCRRQGTGEIDVVLSGLAAMGLRLHGFGVKTRGFGRLSSSLASADSMAWSYNGRRNPDPSHGHATCAHCVDHALAWRRRVLASADADTQMALPLAP